MSSLMSRRRAVLGTAALPLGTGLLSLALPKSALACHLYKSPVDGSVGCGARDRDVRNGVSGDSVSTPTTDTSGPVASEPQSPPPAEPPSPADPPPSTTTSTSGLVYRDELCGFNQSRKGGSASRLSVGSAPDGKRAIRAAYVKGQSACAANTFLDLFSGNGVSRATFECDLWFQSGFKGPSGKLFGVYGGGDAYGGLVNRQPGCLYPEGGWSSRVCHDYENRVLLYGYWQNRDMPCSSDGKKFGKTRIQRVTLPTNRWLTFRHQITLNTPGNSNGNEKVWMDDRLLFDLGGLMHQRQSDRYGIKGWSIWNALGGSCRNSSFFPTANLSVWYRDLRVYNG
jgi:hypothetical protein